MPPSLHSELAQAFTHMSKGRVLNKLYAKRAKRDKRLLLSRLLAAISCSEHLHARRTLMYIRGKMGDPVEHLAHLVRSKQTDAEQKYPQLSERLNQDGLKKAAEAFEQFSKVAAVHRKLLEDVVNKKAANETEYYVCQICGHIGVDHAPQKCPVCNAVQEKFKAIQN